MTRIEVEAEVEEEGGFYSGGLGMGGFTEGFYTVLAWAGEDPTLVALAKEDATLGCLGRGGF